MVSRLERIGLSIAIALLTALPILAQQPSNFGTLSLSPGFKRAAGRATGYTSGSFSLTTLARQDQLNNPCLGFSGDPQVPDHVIDLQQPFSNLTIQVKSQNNQNTTLLVRGPGLLLCGDDTGSNRGANVTSTNLQPGIYQVWVGSINSGDRINYTLSVQE
jgi:hypothetical protein